MSESPVQRGREAFGVRKELKLQARDGSEIKAFPNTSSVIGVKSNDLYEPIIFLM